MKPIPCYIVDDEEASIECLAEYVTDTSILHLVGSTTDPFEALAFLQKNEVALLFVDINMEGMSGLELTKLVNNKVIVITAHESYALESYNFENIVGYLLKPITYEKFMMAIKKALNNSIMPKTETVASESDETPVLIIKTANGDRGIPHTSIDYIKAEGDYSLIFFGRERAMTSMPLKDIEGVLPASSFSRIHKSYVVNTKKIKSSRYNKVLLQSNITIPIGRTYRDNTINGK